MIDPLSLTAGLDATALPQQLLNGLMFGAIYALVALGYTMVYGVLKLINFAHGEVFMIGAYTALFVSWQMGYFQGASGLTRATNPGILILMLITAMVVCGFLGVLIERFAYRPMRKQPRIASLITAIGVSMLLQYGGALVLPVSPPRSILEQVNPYDGNLSIPLKPRDGELNAAFAKAKEAEAAAKATLEQRIKQEGVSSEFDLSDEGKQIRSASQSAAQATRDAENKYLASGMSLNIPYGQGIMFLATLALMGLLTYLVMFTKTGRQMRAVAHDFDSASLMGINVDKIVTITFIIGSSLAGAGAMMCATFLGTQLTSFVGVPWGVKAFVAAVLGGIGNIPGAVLGGLLIGVAETMVVWAGGSQYKDAIAFVILILVLLVKPGGLLGSAKVEKV
ncbi:MAG: branched-chain amino acid ABC transporter permease [Chthonomonas sp.]|nr:branched-chain amino acid ABC transporter permease [Chthonomonas sp.]